MQQGAIFLDRAIFSVEFPTPDEEVLPGVQWGSIEAFPTPAYWAYQVYARRLQNNPVNYKLGSNLKEEVGACLLGGHGIPANVGLAAFDFLKQKGVFVDTPPLEDTLKNLLTQPLTVNGRSIHYRFAKQKARYLAAALEKLTQEQPPLHTGKALRDWLLSIPGIGYKTASWIARNWLDADDVAILDIHILRAGLLGGFFQNDLTVERHYLELEEQFLRFSEGLGVRPSELDALIWVEMMSSQRTVHDMLGMGQKSAGGLSTGRAKKRHSDSSQLALIG